ncbi:MAG: hypothetical protein MR877_11535 [Spirochaetia bacterium]|nr:hypothetical protein [Spirochaetia bacterium]
MKFKNLAQPFRLLLFPWSTAVPSLRIPAIAPKNPFELEELLDLLLL